MALVISVLVKDGIVLAGDSLTPLTTLAQQETPEPSPTNSISRRPTIFPFYKQFGIGIWKQDSINGKPVHLVMRELESKFEVEGVSFNTVTEVVQATCEEMRSIKEETDPFKFTDVFKYFVAGYSGQNAEIVEAIGLYDYGPIIGIEGYGPLRSIADKPGCLSFGDTVVADSIEKLYGEADDPPNPPFGVFSLQTAIDYALFLIRTTIEFQQFSRTESTLGKAIDVAVITHLEGFRWVQRQSTAAIL